MLAFTYYSINTYTRWKDKPVVLGFDEQLTDIFDIPFPAITICSNIKFDKREFDLEYALKKYQSTGGSVDEETWVAKRLNK